MSVEPIESLSLFGAALELKDMAYAGVDLADLLMKTNQQLETNHFREIMLGMIRVLEIHCPEFQAHQVHYSEVLDLMSEERKDKLRRLMGCRVYKGKRWP